MLLVICLSQTPKVSESQFFDMLNGYRKETLPQNGLSQ